MVRAYLANTLAAYSSLFGETEAVQALRIFMKSHANVTSRKNLAGHVTGSALVWHKASNTVLRVQHAKWKCWVFSAGGHVEDGEQPWQASIRELLEETGISASPLFDRQNPIPLIVDAHSIPHSVKKSEPAHWHYDLVYLFSVEQQPEIIADATEISDFHWVEVSSVTQENSPVDLREQLLSYGL